VAFFSSFLPCSRFSAAVRNRPLEEAPSGTLVFLAPELFPFAEMPLDLDALALGASSSLISSSEETAERREDAEERDAEDLTERASSLSESEGAMKSSSSDAAERALRPIWEIY
jgi:hypothetical protein